MKVRVGLMGFGRVGRNIFRILAKRDDIEVVAISDTADAPSLEYLLKYDSLLGRYPEAVSLKDGVLHAGPKQARIVHGRDPGDVKWGELGVDVVIEATGRPRSRQEAAKHLEAGAKRVILCVPCDDADATVLMGVNHQALTKQHRVISTGSMSAQCAMPVLMALDKAFGIERAYFTEVHAYSSDQSLADVPAADMRRSRAAAENIVPTDAKASASLDQLLPALKGKISGMALKVPVSNGSLVDIVTFLKKPATVQAVNEAVQAAAAEYKKVVEYSVDPIVSSDVKNSPFSSTFDSLATMVLGNQTTVKTISWFDNGWGYAHRAVELVEHLAKMEGGLS